jgi:hypothetical protein
VDSNVREKAIFSLKKVTLNYAHVQICAYTDTCLVSSICMPPTHACTMIGKSLMHNQASDKPPLKNCIHGEQIPFRLIPNKHPCKTNINHHSFFPAFIMINKYTRICMNICYWKYALEVSRDNDICTQIDNSFVFSLSITTNMWLVC